MKNFTKISAFSICLLGIPAISQAGIITTGLATYGAVKLTEKVVSMHKENKENEKQQTMQKNPLQQGNQTNQPVTQTANKETQTLSTPVQKPQAPIQQVQVKQPAEPTLSTPHLNFGQQPAAK